jgi:hypothetical protein
MNTVRVVDEVTLQQVFKFFWFCVAKHHSTIAPYSFIIKSDPP